MKTSKNFQRHSTSPKCFSTYLGSYFPRAVVSQGKFIEPKSKYFLRDGTFLYILEQMASTSISGLMKIDLAKLEKKNHLRGQKMVKWSTSGARNSLFHGPILFKIEALENRKWNLSSATKITQFGARKGFQPSTRSRGTRKPKSKRMTFRVLPRGIGTPKGAPIF